MTGVWALVLLASCGQGEASDFPRAVDPRLKLELFAEAPQIVTPVGIAVDARGRVLVIESHTHFPPPDYRGPQGDRIRLLEDTNHDGRADKVTTFFEGLQATMNLALYPDGSIYVATRSEILRLKDLDEDGVAEVRESLVKLETPGNYPHNGLSGFAFDFAGDVYFGMGENLGADYRLVGADGTTLRGGGEGGNLYRCDRDGKRLTRIATGFWNPFHLTFDAFGRLFAVDNDPDSRPPCRLLHIVEGGDYGYRFRNGRRGTHPFTAWNGELPGTLPMAAGTGEAPSGVIAYESDNWPADYRGDLLVTSWGDHRLDRFRLRPRGASFAADSTPVVVGGEQFRPVGVIVAPDGAVYFSDWVDKSYQLHGKGRVWKLSAASPMPRRDEDTRFGALISIDRSRREHAARRQLAAGAAGLDLLGELLGHRRGATEDDVRPRALAAQALATEWPRLEESRRKWFVTQWMNDPSPDLRALAISLTRGQGADFATLVTDRSPLVRAAALRATGNAADGKPLWAAQSDADPFVRQAAAESLAGRGLKDPEQLWDATKSPSERLALALLVRRLLGAAGEPLIPKMLRDEEAPVRFLAIQWIGEEGLVKLRPELESALQTRANSRLLFESCLAALERLDGVSRRPTDEVPGEQYVVRILLDTKSTPEVRRRALRTLRPDHPELTLDLLRTLIEGDDATLRLEAIRSLRDHPSPDKVATLIAVTRDREAADREQAEAVMGLDATDAVHPEARERLLELAAAGPEPVAIEALRGLRGVPLSDVERGRLEDAAAKKSESWKGLLARVLTPPDAGLGADSADTWLTRLDGPADPEAGERIFFHPRATGCYRCHEFDGRGAGIGPELTHVTRTLSKKRLVESLVDPSREVAPQFVPWLILTESGELFTGMLFGEEVDGTQRYIDNSGRERRFKPAEIAERQPLERSIMPDGLPNLLSEQEFRDLVSFLLKNKP